MLKLTSPISHLTQDEEHLHSDVADDGGAGRIVQLVIRCEADIVGHCNCHVEGGQEDHPIPQSLGHTIVEQDEAGLLHCRHLVLWERRLLKHVLDGDEKSGRGGLEGGYGYGHTPRLTHFEHGNC